MTPSMDITLIKEIMELLSAKGTDGFKEVMTSLLNESMKAERSDFLKAKPYERNSKRLGYANGFKPKRLNTRIGTLKLSIPQVRGLEFYPKALEKGSRSERSLKLAIAEMYINGVSTRRVTEITKELCGLDVSSSQVSRISKVLDDEIEKFRNAPIERIPYLFLDAHYQKVRHDGYVRDMAVLIATGIDMQGKRCILGTCVSFSEASVHWREFLLSLIKRGLNGVTMITSDDHKGLRQAIQHAFPSVPWQRCQFHFAQNAQAFANKKEQRKVIAQDIRDIFNSPTIQDAKNRTDIVIDKYKQNNPFFASWIENSIEECFTAFSQPREYQVFLRTVNPLENINREVRRRTNVVSIFPNQQSCLRLISAILMEIHDDWTTADKYYLNIKHLLHDEYVYKLNKNNTIYRKKVA